jgi:hypothetical protein
MKHEVILEIHHPLAIGFVWIFFLGFAGYLGWFRFLNLGGGPLGCRRRTDVSVYLTWPPERTKVQLRTKEY